MTSTRATSAPASAPPASTPPYGAYGAILSAFGGGLAGIAALAGRGRGPEPLRGGLELAVLSLAVFKGARTLTHDRVASFVREPFLVDDTVNSENEQPLPDGGARQALGELVTCSRCIGVWVAAGLIGINAAAPRFGRTLTATLALGGVNDWLQAGFAAATRAANEIGG